MFGGTGRLGEVRGRNLAQGRQDLMQEGVWEHGGMLFGSANGSENDMRVNEAAPWRQ